jgi:radical SAM superfamily enzyme YgiQ (UPF0313 family)
MQELTDPSSRCTVFLFQPQWLAANDRPRRFPYRILPVLGALRAQNARVILTEQAFDGAPALEWRERMASADLLVAWCAEMYPGTQVPGLKRFFEVAAFPGRPPLVAGGGFFSLIEVGPLRLGGLVDGIVLEPGEVVLPSLLEALAEGRALADAPGVCSWDGDTYRENPPPPRRALPASYYAVLRELDLARYTAHVEPMIFDNLEPALQLLTGAGCAKRCAFCFDERSPYGVFPAVAVIEALRYLVQERGIRQVLLGELDFFHRRDRALEVVRGLAELRREVPELRWFALSSVVDLARFGDGELDLLTSAGCHRIELGSESGSAQHLEQLGKRHSPDDALALTHRLTARGLSVTHNLLFGAPGETPAMRKQTLRFARRLTEVSPRVRLQPRLYQVVPKTTLGAQALKHIPEPPRTLDELARYRGALRGSEDALPWLSRDEERWLHTLVDYLVPLAFEEPAPGPARPLRALLRRSARARCHTGLRLGADLERRAFERLEATALPSAFVP